MPLLNFFKKGPHRSGSSSDMPPAKLTICIPFYVYPTIWEDDNEWKQLAETAGQCKVPIVAIVNPNSGPGDEVNSDYVTGIKILRDAGIQVIGYIHTQYGERPMDLVKADMKKWEDFYQIEGVFIDEASSEHIKVAQYRQICDCCRECGSKTVMLNPGLSPNRGYFEIADSVVIFENYAKEWKGQVLGTDNEQCCILLHSCARVEDMKKALDKIIQGRCGYFYITNDLMPNPWDCLPSYWSEMVSYVNDRVDNGTLQAKA